MSDTVHDRVYLAQLGLPRIPLTDGSLERNSHQIRSWHYGVIQTHHSKLSYVGARWWPYVASRYGARWDAIFRSLPTDLCRFYYAFPRSSPGYMSLLYVHSGPRTGYGTFHCGIRYLELIARMNDANAILCQVTNGRLIESFMNRWGCVRHAQSLGNNHYIKRLK